MKQPPLTKEKIKDYVLSFSLLIFTLSYMFDLIITYTAFKVSPDYFVVYEANKELTAFLVSGTLPVFHILTNAVVVLIPIIFYLLQKRKNNSTLILIFLFTSILLSMFAGMHILAGATWWSLT